MTGGTPVPRALVVLFAVRVAKSLIVENLLAAYRQGAFPMADPDTNEIRFYYALRRGIFPLEPGDPAGAFHVPRSLRRALNSGRFVIRCDTDFAGVVRGCRAPRPDDEETWINDDIAAWFRILHAEKIAHSVEAWAIEPGCDREHLVGGIYGLSIGGVFIGESMFSRPKPRRDDGSRDPIDGTHASKVCLVRLVEHLRQRGYTLFDTQLVNPHLARFGCVEISHDEYMDRFRQAADRPVTWGTFETRRAPGDRPRSDA